MDFYLLLKIWENNIGKNISYKVVNTLKNFLIAQQIQEKIKLQQMHLKLLQKEQFKKQQSNK